VSGAFRERKREGAQIKKLSPYQGKKLKGHWE
jgi:hypothetical protein